MINIKPGPRDLGGSGKGVLCICHKSYFFGFSCMQVQKQQEMGKLVDEPYVFDFTHKNEAMSIDATEEIGTVGRYISHERAVPNVVCRKVEFVDDDRPSNILRHSAHSNWRKYLATCMVTSVKNQLKTILGLGNPAQRESPK